MDSEHGEACNNLSEWDVQEHSGWLVMWWQKVLILDEVEHEVEYEVVYEVDRVN